jgi:hypothetical protein
MLNLLEFLLNYTGMPHSPLRFSSHAVRCASGPHAEQSLRVTYKPPPLNSTITLWNHCPQEVAFTPLVFALPSTRLVIIFHLTLVPPFPHASLSLSSPRLDFPSGEHTSHSPRSLQLQCIVRLTWPPRLNSDLSRGLLADPGPLTPPSTLQPIIAEIFLVLYIVAKAREREFDDDR